MAALHLNMFCPNDPTGPQISLAPNVVTPAASAFDLVTTQPILEHGLIFCCFPLPSVAADSIGFSLPLGPTTSQ